MKSSRPLDCAGGNRTSYLQVMSLASYRCSTAQLDHRKSPLAGQEGSRDFRPSARWSRAGAARMGPDRRTPLPPLVQWANEPARKTRSIMSRPKPGRPRNGSSTAEPTNVDRRRAGGRASRSPQGGLFDTPPGAWVEPTRAARGLDRLAEPRRVGRVAGGGAEVGDAGAPVGVEDLHPELADGLADDRGQGDEAVVGVGAGSRLNSRRRPGLRTCIG